MWLTSTTGVSTGVTTTINRRSITMKSFLKEIFIASRMPISTLRLDVDALRGMPLIKAKRYLEDVLAHKQTILFTCLCHGNADIDAVANQTQKQRRRTSRAHGELTGCVDAPSLLLHPGDTRHNNIDGVHLVVMEYLTSIYQSDDHHQQEEHHNEKLLEGDLHCFENTRETAHALRGMLLIKAKRYLEDVLAHKQAILFTRLCRGVRRTSWTSKESPFKWTSSAISITLLAPVIYKLYDILIGSENKEVDVKQKKKLRKEIKLFLDVILGYCNVCCEGVKDDEDDDSGLIRPLSDLVSIWVCGEGGENGLSKFFPVLSDGVVDWVNEESSGGVGVIGGAVICEAFLLKMCLKFGEGGSRVELQKELRSWAVCSVTGFRNFYFFDMLVKMLLEPNLTVMSLLSSEDDLFLRKVIYDVVILPDYSFLHLEKLGHLSINHIKNNLLARVMVTHEAIELSRKNKDHTKALSYTNAFSGSHLPTLVTKLVTSELGAQGSQLKGSSPSAFLKWMLELEDQGLTLSEGFMSKYHAKLVRYGSRSDVDQPSYKLDAGKTDSDLLFFIDNKGKDGDGDDDDEKIDDSMNDAFVAAARSIQSDTNESGKKRKETHVENKKDQVKFQRYNLVDQSGSKSGTKTSSSKKDDSGSDSEVEDPDSDESLE
ncbi:SNF2 domain protein [Tanacetum coccineum]